MTDDYPGHIEGYKGRGVWVLPGMTGAEVFEGALALKKKYGDDIPVYMNLYEAQGVVITVLERVRSLGAEAPSDTLRSSPTERKGDL